MEDRPDYSDIEQAVGRVFIGALLHAGLVSLMFVSVVFLSSALSRGLQSTSERLNLSSQQMMNRFGPAFDRLDQLVAKPDYLGFKLYTVNTGLFPEWKPPAAATPGPSSGNSQGGAPRPSQKPTRSTGNDPAGIKERMERERFRELIAFVKSLDTLDDKSRKEIIELATSRSFDALQAKLLLQTVGDISGGEANELEIQKLTLFRDFMLIPPRKLGLKLTRDDVEYLTSNYSYSQLLAMMEQDRGIFSLLYAIPGHSGRASGKTSSTAHVTGTNTGGQTGESAKLKSLSVEDIRRLERKEFMFSTCMKRIKRIEKAYEKYKKASIGEIPRLDLRDMREMGFLHTNPVCPEGGMYETDSEGKVACSIHGNTKHPAAQHVHYLSLFENFHKARDKFYAGKYHEARARLAAIVKKYPNHYLATELLGLSQMKLGEWSAAASTLKKACSMNPGDAKLCFNAAMSFYASGNKTLTRNYLSDTINAAWTTSMRSFPRTRDYHLIKERARWMLSPSGNPIVNRYKYQDFRILAEPVFPTLVCENRLKKLRSIFKKLTDDYLDTARITKLRQLIKDLRRQINSLHDFEIDEKERLQTKLNRVRTRYRDRLLGTAKGSLASYIAGRLQAEDLGIEFCPSGERYYFDSNGNLDCFHHFELLPEQIISTHLRINEAIRTKLNEALIRLLLKNSPEKLACYDTQKLLLRKIDASRLSEDYIDSLVSADKISERARTCPTSHRLFTVVHEKNGHKALSCPVHGSYSSYFNPKRGQR